MSLKVHVQVMVSQMDGQEVCNVFRVDTAINTNPSDPTVEAELASQMVGRLSSEVAEEAQERLSEYNLWLARFIQAGGTR